MQLAMNAALVPNVVISASLASCQSLPRSGCPGLPSKRTISASVRRTPTRKFHIIQPVVVNQKTRSPRWASTWRFIFLRCSSSIPPWPWTIGFGSPVVPDE